MIGSLRGRVVRVEEEWVVLEVGGVGYQVHLHQRALAQLQTERGEVTLQIHTSVREDAISLYGFLSPEELVLFRHLLGVERIGPKAALAILSRSEWQGLVEAIVEENYDLLAAAPGIGAKTARRIVLELKGRVDSLRAIPGAAAPTPVGPLGERAVEALAALGFSAAEARRAVAVELASDRQAGAPERTIEVVVRDALRRLAPTTTGRQP
ncbi:MAG: Holliday junction branch migration protein RuvA [Candidatus Dormibacteria bacterium]